MAFRKSSRHKLVAELVSVKKTPCIFCQRKIDDEITYGKLYMIGDIQCHYFCVLLSSCLIQRGKDEEGLFGFLYEDILVEVERSKKHRCSYCGRGGASLGCFVTQCKKQFHLSCGRERNSVSLFYGNYKSYCEVHAPKQSIPPAIMARAKLRMAGNRNLPKKMASNLSDLKQLSPVNNDDNSQVIEMESVCVICYEKVEGYPSVQTFWPPCCARDAWFHRSCLQRMALSAGVHYLKCPLCNNKEDFYEAVVSQGYYVPDRDAAWELEQNAYSEIYERPAACSVAECSCPTGRGHDEENGPWCVKLCMLCGSSGAHAGCLTAAAHYVCPVCTPAAPPDLDSLASSIQAVTISEEQTQAPARARRGPVMPSRMSLRRTKGASARNGASCSTASEEVDTNVPSESSTSNSISSRQDLNLKTPKRSPVSPSSPQKITDLIHSPLKLLEESLKNKIGRTEVIDDATIDKLRKKFRKPKPLTKKIKMVDDILNGLLDKLLKEPKQKELVRVWYSPKKSTDVKKEIADVKEEIADVKEEIADVKEEIADVKEVMQETPAKYDEDKTLSLNNNLESILEPTDGSSNNTNVLPAESLAETSDDYPPTFNTPKKLKMFDIEKDSSLEISENDQSISIDVYKMAETSQNGGLKLSLKSPLKNKKCAFKFSPLNKEVLEKDNIDIDLESFKSCYLNEVSRNTEDATAIEKSKGVPRKNNSEKIVLEYERQTNRVKKRKTDDETVSFKNDIKVRIKWRNEHLKLEITDSKQNKSRKYNQYILKYSGDNNPRLVKPDHNVSPKRRKYSKQGGSRDNLVQTSIDRFFDVKPKKE